MCADCDQRAEQITPAERVAVADSARAVAGAMLGGIDPEDGLDFWAVYAAAKSIADGFRTTLSPKELELADAIADELTRENLAMVGLSTEGTH